jgi:hypothetical protein
LFVANERITERGGMYREKPSQTEFWRSSRLTSVFGLHYGS